MNCEASGNDRLLALFENARQVIKADTAALNAGIGVAVKPVPEKYSTECGMCIEFACSDREAFIQIVTHLGFTPRIHVC